MQSQRMHENQSILHSEARHALGEQQSHKDKIIKEAQEEFAQQQHLINALRQNELSARSEALQMANSETHVRQMLTMSEQNIKRQAEAQITSLAAHSAEM